MERCNAALFWFVCLFMLAIVVLQEVNIRNREATQYQQLVRIEKESEEKYQTLLQFMGYYKDQLDKVQSCCPDKIKQKPQPKCCQDNILPN